MDPINWHQAIEESLPAPAQLEEMFDRLWPICRSLTGNGFRESLKILSELMECEVVEVPSGTQAFDWTVPQEWNITEGYLEDERGNRVIDFKTNNVHVMGYSTPIDAWFTREELEPYLYSLPDQPEAIPYLTSYYKQRWGFCLSQEQKEKLPRGKYHAVIRSSLKDGALTFGHKLVPGLDEKSPGEILFSTYLCHPSLANNELSGPIVTAFLYRALRKLPRMRLGYRFVVVPETIGAIVYLSRYGEQMRERTRAGYVLTCVGDDKKITYKRSRQGDTIADRIMINELKAYGKSFEAIDFFPSGSDERQYCSPGFNLPVGSLMRSMYGTYPEYHTSLDNKSFISFPAMRETLRLYLNATLALQFNETYCSQNQFCEPMLSPRGMYPDLGSHKSNEERVIKMLWLFNQADGTKDLASVAEKAKCSVLDLQPIAALAVKKGLLTVSP